MFFYREKNYDQPFSIELYYDTYYAAHIIEYVCENYVDVL